MKKYLLATGVASLALVATACGSEESSGSGEGNNSSEESNEDSSGDESSSEGSDNEDSSGKSDSSDTEEASSGAEDDVAEGETVENEAGTFEVVKRNDESISVETGPINMSIDEAKVIQGELNDEYQEILERDSAEITYIQVDMTVENTEETPVDFYASQGSVTTNTGEQVESDMFFGDPIDGMFLDAVTQEGYSVFILENSEAEEVEDATLRIDAPVNEDIEEVGDAVEEEIDFTGGN